jgi:methanogenic corrinoid protein MtbC1
MRSAVHIQEKYCDDLYDTKRDLALKVTDSALESGVLPAAIVFDVVIPAIRKMVLDQTINLKSIISPHVISLPIWKRRTQQRTD